MEKTTVFNLIILDESGSMSPLTQETIEGCNETLNLIRSLEEKHGDTQRNLVSIYLFQSNPDVPSRYIYHNQPINEISNMNPDTYRPWGCTPLLDAVGNTLSELIPIALTHEDSTGIVTIITDGMENSSLEFSWGQVANLISQVKKMGWTVNLIGANIDLEEMSKKIHIDNSLAFNASRKGTKNMWKKFNHDLANHEESRIKAEKQCSSPNEKFNIRQRISGLFFQNNPDKDDEDLF